MCQLVGRWLAQKQGLLTCEGWTVCVHVCWCLLHTADCSTACFHIHSILKNKLIEWIHIKMKDTLMCLPFPSFLLLVLHTLIQTGQAPSLLHTETHYYHCHLGFCVLCCLYSFTSIKDPCIWVCHFQTLLTVSVHWCHWWVFRVENHRLFPEQWQWVILSLQDYQVCRLTD